MIHTHKNRVYALPSPLPLPSTFNVLAIQLPLSNGTAAAFVTNRLRGSLHSGYAIFSLLLAVWHLEMSRESIAPVSSCCDDKSAI